MLAQINQEIGQDPYYQQNFPNDGQRFIAWYLRRALLRDPIAARDDITDGPNDKQIDAVVVDDEERKILIIQGKFIAESLVDGEPLREVIAAWLQLQDLPALQTNANDRLKQKLEAVRQALDDEYQVEFELLTTGTLSDQARADLRTFSQRLEDSQDLSATFLLVDTELLETRLAEAEALELPSLDHEIQVILDQTLSVNLNGTQTILTVLPLKECLRFPGIVDGRLFRKNVRQSLGLNNKVNRALRETIAGERVKDFFFYHNGITAICDRAVLDTTKGKLSVNGLNVVNGCQSLSTINSVSERVRQEEAKDAKVLFRLYEIPNRGLAERISVNTNSQSAVKPRDLRSNDKIMVGLKKAFEARYPGGYFITKRGETRPADKDVESTIDASILAKMLMAWHCQRPNISYNEKKLFDEHYKTLFRTGYNPASVYALQQWLNRIEEAWPNLSLNDVLKAGRTTTKYHMLFSISALFCTVNGKPAVVIDPYATTPALVSANDILPLAANCLENAMQAALSEAQISSKIFSPQNWLKNKASVQGQMLVASTIAGMISQFPNGPALKATMTAQADSFHERWSAD